MAGTQGSTQLMQLFGHGGFTQVWELNRTRSRDHLHIEVHALIAKDYATSARCIPRPPLQPDLAGADTKPK